MKHYAGRMAHTYAAKRLLEHGPLTRHELLEITGWKPKALDFTTQCLLQSGEVMPINLHGTRHYALASLTTAGGFTALTGTMPTQPLTTMQRSFRG